MSNDVEATRNNRSTPKHIVVCSDGTGNSAIKDRGTNVFKLYEAIDRHAHLANPALEPQIAFYDDGVGTESFKPLRVLGGAFGWGLSRNVRELYTSIARCYRPGDRIFLFGFSRGAFTVRALAGFITSCGILDVSDLETDAALVEAVEDLYRIYRRRYMTGVRRDVQQMMRSKLKTERPARSRFDESMARFRNRRAVHEGRVAFIGVWDTVDAVGLPFAHLADFVNYWIYPFKFSNLRLSPHVAKGRHALSIDDERHTFHPYMWDEADESDPARIVQVWFAGVHANVGGGYPKQGMSLAPLYWMMREAGHERLRFVADDLEYVREHQNVHDKLYNSRAGLGVYYRYKPRDIHAICARSSTTPLIHESAIERIHHATEGYAPGNFPAGAEIVASEAAVSRYASAPETIGAGYGAHTSLLDRVRSQIWIRRLSHYAFVGLSAWLVWQAMQPVLAREQGWIAKLKALASLDALATVAGQLLTNPQLFVLIAVFFFVGAAAERSMRRRFSAFWHKVALRL